MGLMEKLQAKRTRKAKAIFADEVIGALRILGVEGEMVYDEVEFAVVVATSKGPHRIFLQNAFRQFDFQAYTKMTKTDKHTAVARFVKAEKQEIDAANKVSPSTARDDAELHAKLEMATKTANLVRQLESQYRDDKHREYREGLDD